MRTWPALLLVAGLLAPTTSSNADDHYPLVNVRSDEHPADGHTVLGQLSRSGRFVLFDSNGPNLSRRDQPGFHQEVYLRDRKRGTTKLVSLDSRERPARGAWWPSISPNGRFVAFCSTDPRLVRPDSYEFQINHEHPDTDVYVRDRRTGVTRRASTTWRGREADDYSCRPSVADTGDVVFISYASNLVRGDHNLVGDVFIYDWGSGRTRRISRGPYGATASLLSGNGRLVLYYTGGPQVRADTNAAGEAYLFRRSHRRYLRVAHLASGRQLAIGCDPVGQDISYTGRFVLVSCRDGAMTSPAVPDRATHLWRVDRRTGTNVLVNPSTADYTASEAAAMSDDGSRVVFTAPAGAVGGTAADDRANLYLWRSGHGVTTLTPGPLLWWWGYTADISGNGRAAIFTSDSPEMSARDLNDPQQTDLFLARVR